MAKTVLVVAAHADDEALGCGGTIARHVANEDRVHVVFMADGVKSRANASAADIDRRLEAMTKARNILGISSVECLDFPDNQMDVVPLLQIVQRLEQVIERIKPSVVYTHYHGDLNVDHRLTHQAVMTACRPVPGSSVREIYGFEILSSSEWANPLSAPFVPTLFVEISDHLAAKLAALEAYEEEIRVAPHTRSVEHVVTLARHRGYSVGLQAAEGFLVYRAVECYQENSV
jgi:N-acetylglucosamine malate deacetylase 1